ncbi:MAG: elongation factor G, partial [Chloroflexi bacterium]|nr:elongation factor G [Chloroflexota bacterium]
MALYKPEQLRNVALVGHLSAGKTSLAEAMLFNSGAITRLGRVDDGNTVTDFDPEEIRRKISVTMGLAPCEWGGRKLNAIDTPGYTDFLGEVKSAVWAADAALVVVDAVSGVEVGTEQVWAAAQERGVPRLVFVNKMDRENAAPERVVQQLEEIFGARVVEVQLPMGKESAFQGVVDLLTKKAYLKQGEAPVAVPADMAAAVDEAYTKMLELAAEGEDALIEKYLEEGELSDAEVLQGLRSGVRKGQVVPVFYGAATPNVGVRALMDGLFALAPHPGELPAMVIDPASGEQRPLEAASDGPLAALVFKTVADPYVGKLSYFRVFSGTLESDSRVHNSRTQSEERIGQLLTIRGKEQLPTDGFGTGDMGAVTKLSATATGDTLCERGHPVSFPTPTYPYRPYTVSVSPKTKADSAKISVGLARLVEEDPSLEWHQEPSTRQIILSGMGDVHIDVAVRRLNERLGVGVVTEIPKVPYKESITKTVSTQYRHKKQTGGAGQFAEVHMRVEPLPQGSGYEFAWEVFGGHISGSFQPSIEKGIRSVIDLGVVAGYPVVDIKCAVFDGKEHPVDSKDIAFQIAGREVFKKAVMEANPVLLEPIMTARITVPEQYMGDVIGDVTSVRRGRVQDTQLEHGKATITAQVPMAEVLRYGPDLRSMTQG